MSFNPKKITQQNVFDAVTRIQSEGLKLKDSTKYDVVIDGQKYPPKEIMRLARFEYDGSKEWNYSGGNATNNYLEGMGFNIVEKSRIMKQGNLNNIIRERFQNIWRCADSGKWGILKEYNLLTFDWLNNDINYNSIDLDSIGRGKRAIKPWVTKMKMGDLVFVMGKNEYNGIAIIQSEYSFQQNIIEMGSNGVKPSVKVKYIHKLDSPIKHSLETHNNPTTFASIDKYNFGLERTLDMLKSNVPEAYQALTNYVKDDIFNLKIKSFDTDIKQPLNQILYGPPGTGKTYQLQKEYFPRFTVSESKLSREQYIENAVADLTWWQTFAVALYDLGLSSSTEILNHEIVKAKERQSSAKSIKPILWSRLQAHTVLDCPNVNVKTRSEPQLFFKNDTSKWRVDNSLLKEAYPEALEILDKIKNFQPEEGKIIKNYEFVTFHQSFSYEDFVEGIKPKMEEQSTDLEYEIQDGVFKRIALKAKADPENDYAIFIDEINRGNVSAIFGELITLIEKDKRLGESNALEVKLPYSRTHFGVPANLYIFGTMNTADRSVEGLDTALRRRFAFEEVMPKAELFEGLQVGGISIKELLEKLNQRIEALLDRDHTIGHSYFYKVKEAGHKEAALKSVFKDNIIPLLQEYFYGDYSRIGLVLGEGFVQVEKRENIAQFAKVNGLDNEVEITPRCKLIPINEDFKIISALEKLLNHAEA